MERPQVKVNNSNKCNPDKAIVKIDALLDEFVKSLHSDSGAISDKAQEEHEQSKESKEEQELTADEKGALFVWWVVFGGNLSCKRTIRGKKY